ncbi:hypothetical protein IW261DRAFT_1426353 [Armillaria novae-zelandiae]|uniref:Uncharacterized protein n=1 Tax=Armillaria novae-zelandiae TaxID=153914 RepID=A0AA39U7C1_9AGAR|nr:hypothetical protein IW261DRAFT_1426353 [Armillaria novae-zelandiae]
MFVSDMNWIPLLTYLDFIPDATGAPHLTFKENPILDNEADRRTANRQTGTSHTGGNAAFPEEAKWRVIKTHAMPLSELVVTGPTIVPWPSSRHHGPGNTIWFNSKSPEDIALPGQINPMPDVGTLYIHHNSLMGLLQIWVLQVDRTWGVLSSFHCRIVHPDPQHHDRYFQLSKDMKPSWVTDATKAQYEKESEKKAESFLETPATVIKFSRVYECEAHPQKGFQISYTCTDNSLHWYLSEGVGCHEDDINAQECAMSLYKDIKHLNSSKNDNHHYKQIKIKIQRKERKFYWYKQQSRARLVLHAQLQMSAFLDLEAGVAQDDKVDSPCEDDEQDNFIVGEDDQWDDAAHSTAFRDFYRVAASLLADQSQAWNSFLERARSRANVPRPLENDSGWEESVVLHIGRCARPELGIKATFIIPLVEEKVWLEANISSRLKDWLVEIPGVVRHNQQVVLHAISPEDSRRCWVKVRHGRSRGEVGMASKMYPWGCNVLLAPKLDLHHDRDKWGQCLNSESEPKLFNVMAIEKAGYRVLEKGPSSYRFRGFMYDHDLLTHRLYFSQIEIANEIPDKLACLFAQSAHPLVRKSLQTLPRVSEWCFQVGEVITDISRRVSGTVRDVGEHGLDVEFADGLFPVRWVDCKKEFKIGTYVEITGEEQATRWSGWVYAIDNGLLHLICRSGPDNERIEIRGVHPNSVSAVSLPNITSVPLDSDSQHLDSVSNMAWKGVMVQVVKRGHCWHGKTGYVVDVDIVKDPGKKKEILLLLVQLSHYDPNAPFVSLWFRYLDVVDEESWLPLNEARPIVKDTDYFRNLVPDTNVLRKRGRRPPPPEPAVQPQSVTPLPDPTERCLSPTWNPSSPDPPPIEYWCLNRRLLGARFRVQYNSLKITALVKYDSSLEKIVCTRDDTPLGMILDPPRVLAIHPKIRHYDMFLVISGEHCGKWVRSIRFHKRLPTNSSDLDWTVAVVIPRAPFMDDDVTDETLVLHSSIMTIADEMKISRQLNSNLRKRLREAPQSH